MNLSSEPMSCPELHIPEQLPLLYQDECMVVVDKPAGLLVHRSMIDRHETRFAMQMVRDQIGQHVFPVHRLDKPTAGILVFALNSETARLLSEQLAQHLMEKRYLAVVRGYIAEQGIVDHPLQEKLDKIADKKARQDKPAQEAISAFRCLQQVELPHSVGKYPTARYSLVLLGPQTGRKHQLRRHMSHLRHPIVGDVNYGDNKHNRFLRESCNFPGLALWSHQIKFSHPHSGEQITLNCSLSDRFEKLWTQWGLDETTINHLWRTWWPV
ncbi:tRNA pseudouridine(65) synthase TruC [Planctobacterium marinum]|uniref:tRNA pseudouridine(65) synthase TruC n=1 Tax=Planctobacterium marinum TaxID=1631968 RepID=UPI001E4BF337|nr:tRNA pseudouridine(65) synthase TruC [Planctobacterium marinum]MCC2606062.1 tRNA pseudouridine(65) synthase TruC [Planctobacterium marinum]